MYGLAVVVVASAILLLQNPVVASTHECDFGGIFNFGDSNSDTGGLSAAFGILDKPHIHMERPFSMPLLVAYVMAVSSLIL